jgi:hypothetical protein
MTITRPTPFENLVGNKLAIIDHDKSGDSLSAVSRFLLAQSAMYLLHPEIDQAKKLFFVNQIFVNLVRALVCKIVVRKVSVSISCINCRKSSSATLLTMPFTKLSKYLYRTKMTNATVTKRFHVFKCCQEAVQLHPSNQFRRVKFFLYAGFTRNHLLFQRRAENRRRDLLTQTSESYTS